MKKYRKILCIVISVLVLLIAAGCQSDGDSTKNEDAKADKSNRYLMIQNETGKTINEVHVMDSNGSEIESMEVINPDEKTFSLEIPKQYDDDSTFTVVFVDVREKEYSKTVTDVGENDKAVVKIEKSDKVKKGLFE